MERQQKEPMYFNYATNQYMPVSEIQKELKRRYDVPGRGITCMIPGKYSREYADYFIGQLADHFGFEFFKNKISELKMEKHQRFKPYREYLETYLTEDYQFIIESAKDYAEECQDGIKSVERFEDMMFFDGLIMNNKRNIDNFGFIVDKEKKNEFGNDLRYSFVCFYDEYNSFFDHLNGIDFDRDAPNALSVVESWTDNDINRMFIGDLCARYAQRRHIEKIQAMNLMTGSWRFQDNEQFKLEEIQYIKKLKNTESIYRAHLHYESRVLPVVFERGEFRKELLHNDKRREEFMNSKNIADDTISEEDKKWYFEEKFYEDMRRDPKINPRIQHTGHTNES